ncbi:hypothetical protein FHJ30_05645 [Arthrobacter sp. BB-1]|nr:hypothetical protein FHJ30_05645 [Arthrobacter sp. BB-1]
MGAGRLIVLVMCAFGEMAAASPGSGAFSVLPSTPTHRWRLPQELRRWPSMLTAALRRRGFGNQLSRSSQELARPSQTLSR